MLNLNEIKSDINYSISKFLDEVERLKTLKEELENEIEELKKPFSSFNAAKEVVLNGYNIHGIENPAWVIENIYYDKTKDKFYFTCKEAD